MTPEWVTEALLDVVPMYGIIWEPACGEGGIVDPLERMSHGDVIATDIDRKFSRDLPMANFLAVTERAVMAGSAYLTIVTNPPYGKLGKLAEAFVRHALDLTKASRGRVCMLLPIAWDAAKSRQDLFEDYPGHITKITLTERIRWTNLPQSKNGPSENHAWFVWDWSRRGRDMRWMGKINEE